MQAPINETALDIFGGLSGSYDRVLDYVTLAQDRRWKTWAIRSVSLKPGWSVLDVGCGTCVLEERLPGDRFVVGLDLSESMLRVGQSKRLPSVSSLMRSDAERLPFRNESFDAVLSCYVVKYCATAKFVSEMLRILKPGGRLVLYDFVKPRGQFWPLNALYVYGGLRIMGALLRLAHSRTTATFTELPGIISGRPWERDFELTMVQSGAQITERRALSGGVALGFSATKTVLS
jgi:demethylmenaquinone methyltransferase/2-methoxy-6-polyprenyl-1,4-benzoquinol methylase